jgi:hypothetical protein
MRSPRILVAAPVVAVLLAFAPAPKKPPAQKPAAAAAPSPTPSLDEDKAYALAREAFTYGFPLVVTDLTRARLTRSTRPDGAQGAPVNQFANFTEVPNAKFDAVVAPNADTLYSSAFVDLEKEPIVFTVPPVEDRYVLFPILDAWTNVLASPGTRTTGALGGNYLLLGPGWKGTVPAGVIPLACPTNRLWIIGRILIKNRDDLGGARAVQAGLKLTPLSSWGKAYQPPVGPTPAAAAAGTPSEQVREMGAHFYVRMAELMKAGNWPAPHDLPLLRRLAALSLVPGQPFPLDAFNGPVRAALERAVQEGWKDLQTSSAQAGANVNGWRMPDRAIGDYGTDYALRAKIAFIGLGASTVEDTVYARALADSNGATLDGTKRYIFHFTKDALPPVNGAWSVTVYDTRNLFFDNPLERYKLGDRDNLKKNADGSIDLYVGATTPGPEREPNWLPIPPQGPFSFILRLYWPKADAIDGKWKPPHLLQAQ